MVARRRDVPGTLGLAVSALPGRRLIDLGDPELADLTKEAPVPKIEGAIKEAIHRGAGRQIRQATTPLHPEVRRLRQLVAALRTDVVALKAQGHRDPLGAIGAADAVVGHGIGGGSPGGSVVAAPDLGVSQAALGRLGGWVDER
jgi:hypothetical protein